MWVIYAEKGLPLLYPVLKTDKAATCSSRYRKIYFHASYSLDSSNCVICATRQRVAFFIPCGHTLCMPCAVYLEINNKEDGSPFCKCGITKNQADMSLVNVQGVLIFDKLKRHKYLLTITICIVIIVFHFPTFDIVCLGDELIHTYVLILFMLFIPGHFYFLLTIIINMTKIQVLLLTNF